MKYIEQISQIPFEGKADSEAIVQANNCRFTVLAPGLIRMEYDPDGRFEDWPSQLVWYRKLPKPNFNYLNKEEQIEIETDKLSLIYKKNKKGFTADSLVIIIKETGQAWHYGDKDINNLLGTCRTLDGKDGETELENGLISCSGWTVIDDSNSLVFNKENWLENRSSHPLAKDLYFFCYEKDYYQCIKDFIKITGQPPLIPRWALGNWWSRFWQYSQEELKELMMEFKEREIPLSVCIVDMDWHIVENEYTNGWTGFTWNRQLFPKPKEFIAWLHENGLKTALNLHPADGIHPHEDQYVEMARHMGINPDSKKEIKFDIVDPKFVEGYFRILLHPLEEEGVDFWWIDWQQGETTKFKNLDPLWALNHLHFYDCCQNDKRPLIFSRWGGLGSHRYPIGFSGDTTISWKSLSFQPYFTATAANVAYNWWSHDIGGHRMGQEDPELYARWVQYGVFSPILRLHCTKNPYLDRTPWGHGEDVFKAAGEAMRLRHSLIPYLYTMAWYNHQEGYPLIRPLYWDHPEDESAYSSAKEYYFGSELIAAPFVEPCDKTTNLSRQMIYLPSGDWFNFFTNEYYQGDRWYAVYGNLLDIPVFAKAGAIVPLDKESNWGKLVNPVKLELNIFPGSDNSFILYEDEGEGLGYKQGRFVTTKFSQRWQEDKLEFNIMPSQGDMNVIPEKRDYSLIFRGIKEPSEIIVYIDDRPMSISDEYDIEEKTLTVCLKNIEPVNRVKILLNSDSQLLSKNKEVSKKIRKMLTSFRMETNPKPKLERAILDHLGSQDTSFLKPFIPILTNSQRKVILEVFFHVGVHRDCLLNQDKLIAWNYSNLKNIEYTFHLNNDFGNNYKMEQVSELKIIDLKKYKDFKWKFYFNYADLVTSWYSSK